MGRRFKRRIAVGVQCLVQNVAESLLSIDRMHMANLIWESGGRKSAIHRLYTSGKF